MPPVAAAAAVVGAAALVVGTVKTIKNQKKMVKAQKEAMRFERQKQELQSMRQKLEAVRTARNALADATQAAENQGVADSSSAQGGQSSIISQGLANLSFLDQYGFLSDQAGQALERAAKFQGKASMWSSIADAGSKLYSMSGGFEGRGFTGPSPPAGG